MLLIETHFWSKLKHHLITNSKCTVSQEGRFWVNQRGILCLGLAAPCSSGIRSWRLDSPTPAHFSTRSASQSQILCFICKTSALFSPKNLLTQLRTNSPTWEPFLSAENHFSHLGTFYPTWEPFLPAENHSSHLGTLSPSWEPLLSAENNFSQLRTISLSWEPFISTENHFSQLRNISLS